MKPGWVAVALGLVVVAGAAFLIGRSSPRRYEPPSPETGGPVPSGPVGGRGGGAAPAVTGGASGSAATSAAGPGHSAGSRDGGPVLIDSGVYTNPKLRVTIRQPKGDEWSMTDNRRNFRVPHPSKVLEIRRSPTGSDARFAIVQLYALTVPGGSTAAGEVHKLERVDKGEPASAFKLVSEDSVDVGGQHLARRIVLWNAKGRETKLMTLRCTVQGKLWVLMAFTEPRHFDELMPEFEQAIQSLRFR